MGACVTTSDSPLRPGNQPATSARQHARKGCSLLPIIGRRLPASSSFVLARA